MDSDYQCPHCWHTSIGGRDIGPGERMCCMCHTKELTMPLLWEGDDA